MNKYQKVIFDFFCFSKINELVIIDFFSNINFHFFFNLENASWTLLERFSHFSNAFLIIDCLEKVVDLSKKCVRSVPTSSREIKQPITPLEHQACIPLWTVGFNPSQHFFIVYFLTALTNSTKTSVA